MRLHSGIPVKPIELTHRAQTNHKIEQLKGWNHVRVVLAQGIEPGTLGLRGCGHPGQGVSASIRECHAHQKNEAAARRHCLPPPAAELH